MIHLKAKYLISFIALFFCNNAFAATDSYRWLHVTIDTPWAIFIFLLPMVLFPVVLMAILYWRFSGKETATSKWTKRQNELSRK
ncbi:MAG: hypothetical protein OEM38_00735 [Gammaproteobacteria bacterium]|nr:hypothetical protein [Gammaproteobacteria bacterium]